MSYNGHANWATWNVNLWIGNDESLYFYWKNKAEQAFTEAGESLADGLDDLAEISAKAKNDLAETLKAEFLADDAFSSDGKSRFAQDCDRSDLENDVVWEDVADSQLESCETEITITVEYQTPTEADNE